jgi:hypothetical protein
MSYFNFNYPIYNYPIYNYPIYNYPIYNYSNYNPSIFCKCNNDSYHTLTSFSEIEALRIKEYYTETICTASSHHCRCKELIELCIDKTILCHNTNSHVCICSYRDRKCLSSKHECSCFNGQSQHCLSDKKDNHKCICNFRSKPLFTLGNTGLKSAISELSLGNTLCKADHNKLKCICLDENDYGLCYKSTNHKCMCAMKLYYSCDMKLPDSYTWIYYFYGFYNIDRFPIKHKIEIPCKAEKHPCICVSDLPDNIKCLSDKHFCRCWANNNSCLSKSGPHYENIAEIPKSASERFLYFKNKDPTFLSYLQNKNQ